MPPNLTSLPDRITAGTTVKYSRTYADYRADQGWTARLWVAGKNLLQVDAATNGVGFDYVLSAAATAALDAGNYTWREQVTKSGETYVAESGVVTVLGNIAAAEAGDFQSLEERSLPMIEAVLAGRLTADVQSYQIAGRAITKIPVKELLDIRARFRATVRAQQHPGRLGAQVLAAFTGTQSESGPVGPI